MAGASGSDGPKNFGNGLATTPSASSRMRPRQAMVASFQCLEYVALAV